MDNKNGDQPLVAKKNSKLGLGLMVVAVIVIAGLAFHYLKPAPAIQVKQAPLALVVQEPNSPLASTSTPAAARTVQKASQNTGTATLSWNANTDADLAGYKIYYGTSPRTGSCPPGGYGDNIDVKKTATPKKPSYKFSGLQNGRTYYFSITSYNTSGAESCFSPQLSKAIPAS